jgi:transposase
MLRMFCNNCGGKKLWKLSNGEYRCSHCRKDFKPHPVKGLRLSKREWRQLIKLFLLEVNSPTLSIELKKNIATVSKALKLIRLVMYHDVPQEVFEGTVEVDETYLGGQKKNKRKSQLKKDIEIFGKESKKGFGTTKQPVFGILCRSGKVFAELVDKVEAKDLIPIITKKVKPGTRVCSDTWRAYTGLATKGYVHRTVEHGKKEYTKGKNHINGLEGFWGYLKRKLASKGGIRRKYLHLFLGEYVWRYNHKMLTLKQKTDRLLNQIYTKFGANY